MKHFMLKFNHGVEIGAALAYNGHYARTQDMRVKLIEFDEIEHKVNLEVMLRHYNERPSLAIDFCFTVIGNVIRYLCRFSPRFLLNFVARSMESFAIFNYVYLIKKYPEFEFKLYVMAATEIEHEKYFKL